MAMAQKQAEMFYTPLLNEIRLQQNRLHLRNLAQAKGIEAVYAALQGSLSGPYAQLAGNEGQLRYLAAIQEGNQAEQDLASRLAELLDQQGGKAQDILGDLRKEQYGLRSDYEGREESLYKSGLISQREYAKALGLPHPERYPSTLPTAPANLRYYTDAAGNRWVLNEETGQAQKLPGEAKAEGPPDTFGSASTGVYAWQQTPNGWKPVLVVKPTGRAGSTAKPPSTVTLPNGDLAVWQQTKTGWKLLTIAKKGTDPTKPTIMGPGGVPLTNDGINDAAATVVKSIASARRKGIPIEKVIDAFENEGIPAQIYAPIIARKYGIPLNLSPGNLRNMGIERLRRTAAFLGWRPGSGTHSYTTPGGTARTGGTTKQEFIAWIQAHLPKAEATAATVATGAGAVLVNFAKSQLGQPYVWGGESRKEGGFDCSGLVDFAMRATGYTGPRVTSWTLAKMGTSVKGQALQPGDLIITNHGKHVVMYAGDGKVIAGSSAAGKVVTQPLSQFRQEDVRRLGGGAGGFVGNPAQTGGRVPKVQTNYANKYGAQFGVDPLLLLAIAGHETEWGTTGAGRQGYTLGYGVTDSGILSKYRGVANQYRWAAMTLAKWGVHTLADLLAGKASAYASDPNWERGVAAVYRSLGSVMV